MISEYECKDTEKNNFEVNSKGAIRALILETY